MGLIQMDILIMLVIEETGYEKSKLDKLNEILLNANLLFPLWLLFVIIIRNIIVFIF